MLNRSERLALNLLRDDDKAFVLFIVIPVTICFVLFWRSFEPAVFLITEKHWQTTSQLVHSETGTDYVCAYRADADGEYDYKCEWETSTETIVDVSIPISGGGTEPIAYALLPPASGNQRVRQFLDAKVVLTIDHTQIIYTVNADEYGRIPLGGYCTGEVGWFDTVRGIDCNGR